MKLTAHSLLVILLLALYPVAGLAELTDDELATEPPPEDATFDDYAHLVPDTPEGAISWELLGNVERPEPGADPDYPDEIKALDGETIRIMGFIYPMQNQEQMDEFLLTALPPSCPFCLPAGAGYLIETHTGKPIRFTWDPVLIEGSFEILEDDPYGLFYRLRDARLVE